MIEQSTSVGRALNERDNDIKTRMWAKNGVLHVLRTQDVEPYLEENKRRFNSVTDGRRFQSIRRDRPLREIADIPNSVVEQWLKEGINIFSSDPDMQKKWRRRLDDPDFRHLKSDPGRIGTRSRHF